MRREGAATKASNGCVKYVDSHFEPRIGIDNAHAARIVQVQRDRHIGEAVAHGPHHPLDGQRRGPGHCVGEREVLQVKLVLNTDVDHLLQALKHGRDRDVARKVTAEGGLKPGAVHGHVVVPVKFDHLVLRLQVLLERALLVAHQERCGSAQRQRPGDVQLLRADGPLEALCIEPERGVFDSRRARDAGNDFGRVPHARHILWWHERHRLDLTQSRF